VRRTEGAGDGPGTGAGHAGVVSGVPGSGPIRRTGTLGDIGGQHRRAPRASRPPGRPAEDRPGAAL